MKQSDRCLRNKHKILAIREDCFSILARFDIKGMLSRCFRDATAGRFEHFWADHRARPFYLPFPRRLISLPSRIFAKGIWTSLLGALSTFRQVVRYFRVFPIYLPFSRRLIGHHDRFLALLHNRFFALGHLGTLSTFKQVIGYIRVCPFYLPFPRRLISLPGRLSAQLVVCENHCWALCALLGRSTGTSLLLAFSETFDQSPWSHIRKGHLDISAGRFENFSAGCQVLPTLDLYKQAAFLSPLGEHSTCNIAILSAQVRVSPVRFKV